MYRQHADNQFGVNYGMRAFVFRLKRMLDGWGLTQSILTARIIGLGEEPFVLRWVDRGRLNMLYLALNANQCRRRKRDKFLFAFIYTVLFFLRGGHK
jgi:rhamnosyltransferase